MSQFLRLIKKTAKVIVSRYRISVSYLIFYIRKFEALRNLLRIPRNEAVESGTIEDSSILEKIEIETINSVTISPIENLGRKKAPIFSEFKDYSMKPISLNKISKGIVWGAYGGAVFDQTFRIINDLSPDKWANLHSVHTRIRLPKKKYLRGTSFLLADGEAYDNYHHWMFDVLPKLQLAKLCGVNLEDIDHFLIYAKRLPFQMETLGYLGVPKDRIVNISESTCLLTDELIVIDPMRTFRKVPPCSVGILRNYFLQSSNHIEEPFRKIFLSRNDASFRRVTNEKALLPILSENNFEIISFAGLSVKEQIRIVQQSKIVVGPTGSTMSNITFANPGCKLLELFSPAFVDPFTLSITSQVAVDHFYLVGEDESHLNEPDDSDFKRDIEIDPSQFLAAIRYLCKLK